MPELDQHDATERTHLLLHVANDRRLSVLQQDEEAASIVISALTKEEAALSGSTVGERLPYNDYTTIDWLHDLVLPDCQKALLHHT
jgi:chloride channel 3/4/5